MSKRSKKADKEIKKSTSKEKKKKTKKKKAKAPSPEQVLNDLIAEAMEAAHNIENSFENDQVCCKLTEAGDWNRRDIKTKEMRDVG